MKSTLSFLLLGCLSASSAAQNDSKVITPIVDRTSTTGPAQSILEIQELRDRYHSAVTGHDGPGLLRLVLPQASLWLTALDEESFLQLRKTKPDTQKVHASNFQQFAAFLNSSKAQLDPQSSDVRIITDGTIATVYFDFKFLIDGAVQNQGSETWQLINAEDGWKIAAITYSSNPLHK